MDESNRLLFNILRISGPAVFFAVIFAVLTLLTDLGILASLAIATGVAVLNFWLLSFVMTRLGKMDP